MGGDPDCGDRRRRRIRRRLGLGLHQRESAVALMVLPQLSLYDRLWEILEETFVDAPAVDLNTAKGQATMQSAIAHIVAAFGDAHAFDLDAH